MARSNVRRARRAGKRKSKRPARKGGVRSDRGQMATIRETVEFNDIIGNTGYNLNFNLSQFRRASALAPNFKWYKAVSVEWTLEPLFNTFQDGVGSSSMPYLYETMNRTQDSTGINLQDMQAMGSKPKKLTNKHVTKYTPNWCSPGLGTEPFPLNNITNFGLKAQYSYLASPDTNLGLNNPSIIKVDQAPGAPAVDPSAITANMVIYNGHTIWVDQDIDAQVDIACARVVCNVVWHFKDPHYTTAVAYTDLTPK